MKNTAVHLTPQEQALLAVLQQNRGKVMPRASLMALAWGYPDGCLTTRTLDVHIQHLRRKLGAPIETVYRVGYRLAG